MTKSELKALLESEDSDDYEDVEDGIIKDSVLKLTSNTFDEFSTDDFVGAKLRNRNIASQNDLEAEYKGVNVSRKSVSNDNFESDSLEDDTGPGDINSTFEDESEDNNSFNDSADFDGDSGEDEETFSEQDDMPKEASKSYKKEKSDNADNEENSYKLYSKGTLNVADDIKKGNAVRYQISIWENFLEFRIKLQKALAACNRLPQGKTLSTYLSTFPDSDRSKISKTCNNVSSLLELLLTFQKEMINAFPEFTNKHSNNTSKKSLENNDDEIESDEDVDDDESIASSIASGFSEGSEDNNTSIKRKEKKETDIGVSEPPKKKLKLDDFGKELKLQHEEFKPARNQAIQKWNDKTRISSGCVKSSNFSAFEQSTLKQIEQILCDKSRLVKRTQTKRSVYNVLGKEETAQNVEWDPEIFDDDDFYHKLLREFIEQKSSDIANPQLLGRQWEELQNMRKRMKRPIDVRATKGRRLRYTTHTKLVNFMAPIAYNSWTDDAEKELFSSLFGVIKGEK